MPYFTNDDIETVMNIDLNATGEALAALLIPAVSEAAERYTNRKWNVEDEQMELFDGGQRVYFPKLAPIGSVASIKVDGQTLSSDQYFIYAGYIRLSSPASRGYRNVEITYTANVAVPGDVKIALARWVGEQIVNLEASGSTADGGKHVKRAQFGPGEVEYFAPERILSDMPDRVTKVLDRYRLAPV